jgi:predicted phage terminase large subunit-like protein
MSSIKRKMGYEFNCTPAETHILMSDFTEKEISKIKVGDEVVGFERGVGKFKNKLVKTKVKRVFKKQDYVYNLKMESGRFVRCTKDHRWYTGKLDKTHHLYMPVKKGKKLMFVCESGYTKARRVKSKNKEWENRYWAYLGGIFDGDGSAKSTALTIAQGVQNVGVCSRIRKILKGLKIPFREFVKDNSKNSNWHDCILFSLNDRFNTSIRFIRNSEFAKKWQIINKLYKEGGRFIKEKDKILHMKKGTLQDVYAIETETGNYIAWGYASSNSQYLNDPVPPDDADFKREWFKYYEIADIKGLEMNRYLLIDPAISQEQKADYTAMMMVGIDRYANVYVLDIVREHFDVTGIINAIFQQFERWHPQAVGIEEVGFQRTLRYSLSQEEQKRKKYLNVIELKPNIRSKDQRIKALQPQYANGKVLHNRDLIYNIYLEDELLRFPRGKHDDLIDALSYALDIIHPPVKRISRQRGHKYLYG